VGLCLLFIFWDALPLWLRCLLFADLALLGVRSARILRLVASIKREQYPGEAEKFRGKEFPEFASKRSRGK